VRDERTRDINGVRWYSLKFWCAGVFISSITEVESMRRGGDGALVPGEEESRREASQLGAARRARCSGFNLAAVAAGCWGRKS
jgi:hypothetical protein